MANGEDDLLVTGQLTWRPVLALFVIIGPGLLILDALSITWSDNAFGYSLRHGHRPPGPTWRFWTLPLVHVFAAILLCYLAPLVRWWQTSVRRAPFTRRTARIARRCAAPLAVVVYMSAAVVSFSAAVPRDGSTPATAPTTRQSRAP